MAEFFNHGRQDVIHDLLSIEREKNPKIDNTNYIRKSDKIDLEILGLKQEQN